LIDFIYFFLQDCPATLKNGKYYVSYALFTLTITKVTKVAKIVYKYFIAFKTHLPIKIFSPYFVDLLVVMGVTLSTILLIPSVETSSNRDIFFTDDAAKKIFPTSKISGQEIRHQFFLIWPNLTIMALSKFLAPTIAFLAF